MATLVIAAALVYLIGAIRSREPVAAIVAGLGIVLFILGCLGVAIPACFR